MGKLVYVSYLGHQLIFNPTYLTWFLGQNSLGIPVYIQTPKTVLRLESFFGIFMQDVE